MKYSKNVEAEKIVGKRNIPKNAMIFDFPCELDYHCPICKYENETNGEFDTRLEWSEYNGFIYCRVCNKDFPSCLCTPNIDKAIKIYLDCQEESYAKGYKKGREEPHNDLRHWCCACKYDIDTFEREKYEAWDKGYKEGIKDEIECVETSGEHLDLQKKLKIKKKK